MDLNDLASRVKVEHKAVGRESGEMWFEPGPTDQTGWGRLSPEGKQRVELTTIGEYCSIHGIQYIDTLNDRRAGS